MHVSNILITSHEKHGRQNKNVFQQVYNKFMVGGWTSFQSWQTNGTRNMYHANFKATLQSSKK